MSPAKRDVALAASKACIELDRETLELWRDLSTTVQVGPQQATKTLVEAQEERIGYREGLMADLEGQWTTHDQ